MNLFKFIKNKIFNDKNKIILSKTEFNNILKNQVKIREIRGLENIQSFPLFVGDPVMLINYSKDRNKFKVIMGLVLNSKIVKENEEIYFSYDIIKPDLTIYTKKIPYLVDTNTSTDKNKKSNKYIKDIEYYCKNQCIYNNNGNCSELTCSLFKYKNYVNSK